MLKVILDCNGAGDDLVALMYLASIPDIKVIGVTLASTGKAHAIPGARNLATLCGYLQLHDVPVAYGTEKPLSKDSQLFPDDIRETADTIWNKKLNSQHYKHPFSNDAVGIIGKLIKDSAEKVTILATGPLTNLAQVIQSYPDLIKNVEKIVMMGGAVHVPGNIVDLDKNSTNRVAEWNILADSLAAEIVFASTIPITLVPLNVTNQVPITEAYYHDLAKSFNQDLHLIYLFYQDVWNKIGKDTFLKTMYLRDPLAAMILENPELAIYERTRITVNLTTGQTETEFALENTRRSVEIAMLLRDPEQILTTLTSTIANRTFLTVCKNTKPVLHSANINQNALVVKPMTFKTANFHGKKLNIESIEDNYAKDFFSEIAQRAVSTTFGIHKKNVMARGAILPSSSDPNEELLAQQYENNVLNCVQNYIDKSDDSENEEARKHRLA